MAKGSRGGRRAKSVASQQAQQSAPAPQQTNQVQQAASVATSNIPAKATRLTDADADLLRKQQDSSYDASTTAAVKMYISNTNFDGQGHSLSQAMNYALDNGVDFHTMTPATINRMLGTHFTSNDIASMAYTDDYMSAAAHPIGRDVLLQRGAHDDVLRNAFGISDYTRLSEAQLQARLVGQTFQNTSHMSTSYDISKNPFLGQGSGVSGGREVVFRIKAGSNTRMVFGAKAQAEVVLAKGTNFKITDVGYTGKTATPRGRASRRQIVIDVETY